MSLTTGITASRTAGIWPFAVHLDALANTASSNTTDEFRECFYKWTFGDANLSGTEAWGTGADPTRIKNIAYGPFVGHAFERDSFGDGNGSSTVTVQVSDGVEVASAQQALTYYDPVGVNGYANIHVVANGAATGSGLATNGDHTVTEHGSISSFDTAKGYLANNTLVLVKRGDTYTNADTGTSRTFSQIQMNVWGSGAKPIINATANGARILPAPVSNGQSDAIFANLNVQNNGQANAYTRRYDSNGVEWQTVLFYKIDSVGTNNGIWVAHGTGLFKVGCNVSSVFWSSFNEGLGPFNSAELGCTFTQTSLADAGAGNTRYGGYNKFVYSNCDILGGCYFRQHVKLHAQAGTPSQYIVFSENRLAGIGGEALNSLGDIWWLDLAPTSSLQDEHVEYFIVEGNLFQGTITSQRLVWMHGSHGVVRNNLFVIPSSHTQQSLRCISIEADGGPTPDPDDIQVYNNSGYGSATNTNTGDPPALVSVDIGNSGATNITVRNNLASFPNYPTGRDVLKDPNSRTVNSNNTYTDSPGTYWEGSGGGGSGTFSNPSDFFLRQARPGYASGVPVIMDYFNRYRNGIAVANDIGFREFTAGTDPFGGGGVVLPPPAIVPRSLYIMP